MQSDAHSVGRRRTLIGCLCLSGATIFLLCAPPPMPTGWLPTGEFSLSIGLSVTDSTTTVNAHVQDTVYVNIHLDKPDQVDSIVLRTGVPYGDSVTLTALTSGDSSIPRVFASPCCISIVGRAYMHDGTQLADTVSAVVTEESGTNSPPAIQVHPYRTYATPALPCSISIAVVDSNAWQTVSLVLIDAPAGATIRGDSLLYWQPSAGDTSRTIDMCIVATDNSVDPMADSAWISVAVIGDDSPPSTPEGVRVSAHRLRSVTISWLRNLSADYYRIYRSEDPWTDPWALIDSTTDTFYVDSVEAAYYYRIDAVNLFYHSGFSRMVQGLDPALCDAEISFADSTSLVNERSGSIALTVRLSVAMPETLRVWCELKAMRDGGTLDDIDSSETRQQAVFAPGTLETTLTVGTVDDTIQEGDESFVFVLRRPSMATLGADSVHVCTISSDRDSLHAVLRAFFQDSVSRVRQADTTVYVPVLLSAPPDRTVHVVWELDDSLTTADSLDFDLSASPDTLVFAAGSDSASLPVTIKMDTVEAEAPDTIRFRLLDTDLGGVGVQSAHSLLILPDTMLVKVKILGITCLASNDASGGDEIFGWVTAAGVHGNGVPATSTDDAILWNAAPEWISLDDGQSVALNDSVVFAFINPDTGKAVVQIRSQMAEYDDMSANDDFGFRASDTKFGQIIANGDSLILNLDHGGDGSLHRIQLRMDILR